MQKQLTIEVDEKIYEGLNAAYAQMAKDEKREAEALEWSEGLVGDVSDKPR